MPGGFLLLQRLPNPTKRPGHALFMGVAGAGFSPIFFANTGSNELFARLATKTHQNSATHCR